MELSHWEGDLRTAPMDALGRALGRVPTQWQVNLILLDMAAQDPVAIWLREKVRPFYTQA